MSVAQESTAKPVIQAHQTFSQRMREFPWWAVILVLSVSAALALMLRSEQYRAALDFIVNPKNATEIIPGVVIRNGIRTTLFVTVVSYFVALILGLILGIMRVSSNPVIFHLSTLYVEIMRGVPMLVLILWIGFVVVPGLRNATNGAFQLTRIQGAIAGLGMGYAAYLAEVYRAGIESIHRGQMEAARSLGMNYVQAMRYVILPQAIRRVVPPLANNFVAMLKDSALVSVVAVPEILQSARLYVSRTFRAFEGYNSAALLYLILTLLFVFVVRYIEGRWHADV